MHNSLSFYLTESEFLKILFETTYARWHAHSGLPPDDAQRSLVEIQFFSTDRSSYSRIFLSLASDSIGEKNIYHSCYSLCRSLAVVRLQLLFQSKRECKKDREGRRTTHSSIADRCSIRLKITWVQQRQHHRALESARERMLSLALRVGSIPTVHLKTFEQLFWTTTRRKNSRKAQWQSQSRYLCHCAFFVSFRDAGSEKT